jgi:FKBP-type peptidyl-prolyl cis-trans isomerase FkpA
VEAGRSFLAENAKKEGVTTTASGLQYKVLHEGDGPKPSAASNVEVHYRGTLIDGTEFDSSYKRNKSISFWLNQVIPGWTEGVQLMSVGSKYEFYIPFELAYGPSGRPPVIPQYATLIFEVELLGIS